MKLNVNLSDELIKAVDEYAKERFINRTSAIAVLLSDGIQRSKVNQSVVDMGKAMSVLSQISGLSNNLTQDDLNDENSSNFDKMLLNARANMMDIKPKE